MEIPYQRLSAEALRGVLEEFATRDGTDETDVSVKVSALEDKLKAGLLTVLYEPGAGTCQIVWTKDLPKLSG